MTKIKVSIEAHDWFKEELDLKAGEALHFFGKYGGNTAVHTGFSVGMEIGRPVDPIADLDVQGITYFIEEADEWFFSGYDLEVSFDQERGEPVFLFHETDRSLA